MLHGANRVTQDFVLLGMNERTLSWESANSTDSAHARLGTQMQRKQVIDTRRYQAWGRSRDISALNVTLPGCNLTLWNSNAAMACVGGEKLRQYTMPIVLVIKGNDALDTIRTIISELRNAQATYGQPLFVVFDTSYYNDEDEEDLQGQIQQLISELNHAESTIGYKTAFEVDTATGEGVEVLLDHLGRYVAQSRTIMVPEPDSQKYVRTALAITGAITGTVAGGIGMYCSGICLELTPAASYTVMAVGILGMGVVGAAIFMGAESFFFRNMVAKPVDHPSFMDFMRNGSSKQNSI